MRLRDLATAARADFVTAGVPEADAGLDAELLLRHLLGWDRATWLTRRDEPAPADVADAFQVLALRRVGREPMAYLRGVQEFYGREFRVGPGVLIPRPETELLVEVGLAAIDGLESPRILDIGTGSGCLAVTFALEVPGAQVVATDVSAEALEVAKDNARRFDVAARVVFVHAAGTAGLPGPFDLVVSNPPYVPDGDGAGLQPEVRDHEPAAALFAGPDGLDVVRAIAPEARAILRAGGTFALEIGAGQAAAALAVVRAAGFVDGRVRDDLQRIPRVAIARG